MSGPMNFLFLKMQLLLLLNIQAAPQYTESLPVSYSQASLGENVHIFSEEMDMDSVQRVIDSIYARQSGRHGEFSNDRYAFLFRPGRYPLDIRVGYYMQVLGLGRSPGEVIIEGAVRSNSMFRRHVLTNFWRSVENLTIIPTENSTNVWGVSQAAPMRRVHIRGNLQLHDSGYASGGFLADSRIDGKIDFGPQQQWFSRNSSWKEYSGGSWNVLSLGVEGAPDTNWPEGPYTSLPEIPVSRGKPYLVLNGKTLSLCIPESLARSSGPSWANSSTDSELLDMGEFYIADPETDNSESINDALEKGMNLIITPGIYILEKSLKVSKPGTIVFGLGMPSLVPGNGNAALEVSDVDGVIISGLLFDAGEMPSRTLLRIGEPGSNRDHSGNPSWLFDIFCRVGGPAEGSATSCITVNSNDLFMDHLWLWRADHGRGVGWDMNRCANGLVVNGDRVTVYGLFNEHNQEYQTLWNGNGGRVYFYQSELPYDPPSVEIWSHDGISGFASYKVADHVETHEAWCLGVYSFFPRTPIVVDNAIETPESLEDRIHHKFTFWLSGNENSMVRSIINGKGDTVQRSHRKSAMK